MSVRLVRLLAVVALVTVAAGPVWAGNEYNPVTSLVPDPQAMEEWLDQNPSDVMPSSRAAWPGPDGFNYVGSTCVYSWVDITGSGTIVPLDDSTTHGPFPVGFSYEHYGNLFTEFYISDNGFISFPSPANSGTTNQCPLPDPDFPNVISVLWDDLDGNAGAEGNAYYETFAAGSCPWGGYADSCTVVSFVGMTHWLGAVGSAGTWQAILFDNNTLVMQFLDPGTEAGSSSTTGIQGADDAADYGLLYACNTASSMVSDLCLFFERPQGVPILAGSSKTASADLAPAGAQVDYVIDIVNSGTGDATAATLVDPIPANATYVVGSVACTSGACGFDGTNVNWSGTVAQLTTESVTFSVTIDSCAGGDVVNTAIIDDPDITNPVVVSATTAVQPDYVVYFSDFEADDGGFVGTNEWEWGEPTYPAGVSPPPSGINVWGTDLDADANDVNPHVLSRDIDLSVAVAGSPVILSWWDFFGDEASDERQIYINGTLVWDDNGGTDQLFWMQQTLDISAYAGQVITLEFVLDVCCAAPGPEGWYIDDVEIRTCTPDPGVYMSPDAIDTSGCPAQPVVFPFQARNLTGSDGTFNITAAVTSGNATISAPASVAIVDGDSQPFDVELTPDLCLVSGMVVDATVDIDGNGYNDSSAITFTIDTSGGYAYRTAASIARQDHTFVAAGDALYAIGGTDAGATNPVVEIYDVLTDSWSTGPAMSTGLTIIDGGAIGDTIYFPGGLQTATSTFVGDMIAYDTLTDTWVDPPPAAAPRAVAAYAVAACGGMLYRVGGAEDATWPNGHTSAEVYDPGTDTWTALPPMNQGRTWPMMACIKGFLYVAGGLDGTGTDSATAEVYDIAGGTWSVLPDMPATWWGGADFVKNDLFYISGGIVNGASSNQTVIFDPLSNAWLPGPPLHEPRFRLDGDFHTDSGYVYGGHEPVWTPHSTLEYLVECPPCPTDLYISKSDGIDEVLAGDPVTYNILVGNNGPGDVYSAFVGDVFPPELLGVSWTCTASGGATCSASGMDEIGDVVDLPVGGLLSYTADGTVDYDVMPGPLVNTAAVNAPFGYIDLDGGNNVSTDVDDILWLADLWVTKTDYECWSNPGDPIEYHIEVGNSGPRDVFGAPVEDALPAELLNGSWTCVGANGGICDYAGTGDFAQAVDLPVGSWVIITINATVDPNATGMVRNGAYVAAPMPWEDRWPYNDSFLDTNMLEPPVFCDGFESGDTMMWGAMVP